MKFLDNIGLSRNSDTWKRNLLFVSIAQFVTMVGMSSVIPFLPLYIRDLGITEPETARLWSGIIFSGPFFLAIIFSPIWGILGDKYGRKLMIIRALIGLAIAIFLTSLAQNVWQLFALRIFQGAASGMVSASLAFVSANTPETRSGYGIGVLQGSISAGQIIGPFIGGVLSDLTGIRPVFLIVSGLCGVAALLVSIFVKEEKIKVKGNTLKAFVLNFNFVKKSPVMLQLMILIVLAQAGLIFTNPIFPYFVEDIGAPAKYLSTITGVLLGTVGFLSIFFAPVWGRRNDKKDFRKTLRVASSVIAAAFILHIFMPNFWAVFPLRAVIGVFFPAMIPTLYSALSKRSPKDNRGGVMGLASSATLLGSLIAYLSCGIITAEFGINMAFIISAILLFLVTAYTSYKPTTV